MSNCLLIAVTCTPGTSNTALYETKFAKQHLNGLNTKKNWELNTLREKS
jgi:hypothetical protein